MKANKLTSTNLLDQCFPNSVLGPPRGAHFGVFTSTTQMIQIINSLSSFGYLSQLCSARATKNIHPLGLPGQSMGNSALHDATLVNTTLFKNSNQFSQELQKVLW